MSTDEASAPITPGHPADPGDPAGPARSFGSVVDAYDRGRPGYPAEVATWLAGAEPLRVLELGAGTGKLTAALAALGHRVHATDPDDRMLDVLRRDLPDVRVSQAAAEEIPAGDASYDVVVSAQAFHWFDLDRALPEISRVLTPRGRLALVWNLRDERIPWVRRLGRIIDSRDQMRDPRESLAASDLFDEVETAQFGSWQSIDRRSIQDLVLSRGSVAVLDESGREAKRAAALALYDDYGRGMDGMQLPYLARCFRTTALDRLTPNLTGTGTADPADPSGPSASSGPAATSTWTAAPVGSTARDVGTAAADGSPGDLLLIDFR